MIFIHCAGNGDIYATDTESGAMVEKAAKWAKRADKLKTILLLEVGHV
jgi:hypothetical protein